MRSRRLLFRKASNGAVEKEKADVEYVGISPHRGGAEARAPRRLHRRDGEAIGGLHILEALSATGLRSMRYAKEVTDGVGVERILVNDIEEHAVEMIAKNVAHNGLDAARIIPTRSDATATMYAHRASGKKTSRIAGMGRRLEDMDEADLATAPFDVIDLDPYGAPTPFIDSVVQSVDDGGLLAVTATDLTVLCGNNPEKCFAKYGIMPIRRKYCHEMAVRIVLAALERNANRYGRYIVPLVSLQIDFYLRVFVRVYSSAEECKQSPGKLSHVVQARGCESHHFDPIGTFSQKGKCVLGTRDPSQGAACPDSDCRWAMGGPIWTAPTYNEAFVDAAISKLSRIQKEAERGSSASAGPVLKHADRVLGLLTAAREELRDVPLFYSLPSMASTIKTHCPPAINVHAALRNAGYRSSQTHVSADGIKTDAPSSVMWDIFRAWAKQNPPKSRENGGHPSIGARILAKASSTLKEVDFTPSDDLRRMFDAKRKKVKGKKRIARWAPNPEPGWGPKRAAMGSSERQTHRRSRKRADGDKAAATTKDE